MTFIHINDLDPTPAAPLYHFTVWYLERGQDWDTAEIWADDHKAAVREATMQGCRHARCEAGDWDRVKLPDGRVLSRAEYERELAA